MKRNTTNLMIVVLLLGLMISCTSKQKSGEAIAEDTTQMETKAVPEPEDEWSSLFDGETLDGWKRYNADETGPLWSVDDGAILCDGTGLGEGSGEMGGSLITKEKFGNFELELEWKISEGGNSGILYHVVEKPEYAYAYVTGPEYQLMDDASAPASMDEAKKTASTYDMFAPSANKKLKPAGEWNTAKIIYNNGHVEHWLNGQKVLEFEEGSDAWQTRYESSKWTEYSGWCQYKKGSIALQDHGNYTWFRNIKIKKL